MLYLIWATPTFLSPVSYLFPAPLSASYMRFLCLFMCLLPCFFFSLPHSFPMLFCVQIFTFPKDSTQISPFPSKTNPLSASTSPIPTQNLADATLIAINHLYCPSLHICLPLNHHLPYSTIYPLQNLD